MKKLWKLFLIIGLLSACGNPKLLEIYNEKDLIPEGIAFNTATQTIYLSSVHRHKILAHTIPSKETKDFIQEGANGYGIGVGMVVKDGKLFTLSSKKNNGTERSVLLVFDLTTAQLLNSYALKDTTSHFMNDLAISSTNQIYITDTNKHRIYKLAYPDGQLEIFLEDAQIQYPNGIAIAADNDKLFIDSWTTGTRIVDIKSKQILNEKNEATAEIGIDGLKYYEGNLYAIRNAGADKGKHGLIKIALNDTETDIIGVSPLLLGHDKFNLPTTFCIVKDQVYMIANSQMANLNQETNEIINLADLTNTFILKYKLKE